MPLPIRTVLFAGVICHGLMSLSPRTRAESPRLRTDRHGDPLPAGAIARMGTVRWRHSGSINQLAYSPDGKMIAAAGSGRALTLWDTATGKEIHSFPNLAGNFASDLAYSPDGKLLAVKNEGTIFLCDAATGKELRQIMAKSDLLDIAFAPDGKILAATCNTDKLHLWDPLTGVERRCIDCGEGLRPPLAFSPDGKWLAVTDAKGAIRLWDPSTGKESRRITGHKRVIGSVLFSPKGSLLVSVGADQSIRFWDAETGRQVRMLSEKLGGYLVKIAFSPDGALLASGHEDGTIRLWDVASGKAKRHWQVGIRNVNAVAFSPDGKTLVTAGVRDCCIRLWDVATCKEQHPSEAHHGHASSLYFSSDNRTLFSLGDDKRVLWWDIAANRPRQEFAWPGQHWISHAALSPDGNVLAVMDLPHTSLYQNDPLLALWDVRKRKRVKPVVTLGQDRKGAIWNIAFSPDSRLVAAGAEKEIHVWSVRDGKEIRKIEKSPSLPKCLCFSPDDKLLACGMGDSEQPTLRLWDVAGGKERCSFDCRVPIQALAFSPDGKILAAGEGDFEKRSEYLVHLWDTETGKELYRHRGHRGDIEAIAFSPDGKLVASGAVWWGDHEDNAVRLWEAATGRPIRCFKGHHSDTYCFAFTSDGLLLASGAGDSTILLWDITGRRIDGRWRGPTLNPPELEAYWTALADADAAKAYEAVWALAAAPEQAAPFLQKHLPPMPHPDAKTIARLLADLDSNEFAMRQKASAELRKLGDAITPDLLQALAGKPPLEAHRRMQQLIDQAREWTAERLRDHRAIQALEHMHTPQARQILDALAAGAPHARKTEEAKAALLRLKR